VLLEIKDYDCIIVVDCFPGNNNVSLPANIRVNAVLDHHRVTIPDNLFFSMMSEKTSARPQPW